MATEDPSVSGVGLRLSSMTRAWHSCLRQSARAVWLQEHVAESQAGLACCLSWRCRWLGSYAVALGPTLTGQPLWDTTWLLAETRVVGQSPKGFGSVCLEVTVTLRLQCL